MNDTLILGAGPAGLAAAWEIAKVGRPVVVVEREDRVGGLCRSFEVAGCVFDVGPHLFKARSAEVDALWGSLSDGNDGMDWSDSSAIFFAGGLHRSNVDAILSEPWWRVAAAAAGWLSRSVWQKAEHSAEDLLRNRRGDALYSQLYRSHEEKFWGLPLGESEPGWYATQTTGLVAALRGHFGGLPGWRGPRAERTRKSEAEAVSFEARYPAGGAGGLYERLRERIAAGGAGRFVLSAEVVRVEHGGGRVRSVVVQDPAKGDERRLEGEHFVSTIPLQVLVRALDPPADAVVLARASKLRHRDLVQVNLVLGPSAGGGYARIDVLSDDLEAFRITDFGELSRARLDESGHRPVCLEYYCFQGDGAWLRSDAEWIDLARRELLRVLPDSGGSVVASSVCRLREATPVHVAGYREIRSELLRCLASLENLQSVGRNGLFSYNQMSHSIDCGLRAGQNVLGARHRIAPPAAGASLVF